MDCEYSVEVRMSSNGTAFTLRHARGVFYTDRCPAIREGDLIGVEDLREHGTKAFAREAAAYLLKNDAPPEDVRADLMHEVVEEARTAAVRMGIRQVAGAWGRVLSPSDVAAAWAEAVAVEVHDS